jgi:hypothetical protein
MRPYIGDEAMRQLSLHGLASLNSPDEL